MVKDNKSLGKFLLTGIPPAPRGVPQIEVSFDIDVDGILKVSAREKSSGQGQSIVITNTGALCSSEIDIMKEEAEQFATQDRSRVDLVEAKKQLDSLVYSYVLTLDKNPNAISAGLRKEIESKRKKIEDAIESPTITVRQVEEILTDLRESIVKIGAEAYKKVASDQATVSAKGTGESTAFEALDGDDEFKTIEDEILSGLSQISDDSDFSFDYDQDETISGDYETVD